MPANSIDSEDWKYVDGRNVSAHSVPALMQTMAHHSGSNLIIGPRTGTPPPETEPLVGQSHEDGLLDATGASNRAVYSSSTTVWLKSRKH